MYAIVDIAGQQFKVEKDKKIFVHRLEGEAGSKVEFDQVLLIDNDKDVTVGTPAISGAMVTGKILGHLKGDKVLVFKKKRRKGYQKLNGHRQYLTQIIVEDIIEKGATPKLTEKKAPVEKKEATPVAEKPKAAEASKETTTSKAPKAETSKAVSEKPEVTKKKTTAKAETGKTSTKKPAAKSAPKKAAGETKTTAAAKKASPKKAEAKKDNKKEE